jgi:hypothetical protein
LQCAPGAAAAAAAINEQALGKSGGCGGCDGSSGGCGWTGRSDSPGPGKYAQPSSLKGQSSAMTSQSLRPSPGSVNPYISRMTDGPGPSRNLRTDIAEGGGVKIGAASPGKAAAVLKGQAGERQRQEQQAREQDRIEQQRMKLERDKRQAEEKECGQVCARACACVCARAHVCELRHSPPPPTTH